MGSHCDQLRSFRDSLRNRSPSAPECWASIVGQPQKRSWITGTHDISLFQPEAFSIARQHPRRTCLFVKNTNVTEGLRHYMNPNRVFEDMLPIHDVPAYNIGIFAADLKRFECSTKHAHPGS
eukprot:454356-Amphidinium_carterae.1